MEGLWKRYGRSGRTIAGTSEMKGKGSKGKQRQVYESGRMDERSCGFWKRRKKEDGRGNASSQIRTDG